MRRIIWLGGVLCLEHGHRQAHDVRKLAMTSVGVGRNNQDWQAEIE